MEIQYIRIYPSCLELNANFHLGSNLVVYTEVVKDIVLSMYISCYAHHQAIQKIKEANKGQLKLPNLYNHVTSR